MKFSKKYLLAAFFLLIIPANNALACACGCGVFGVGTSSLIPNCAGGLAFLEYDYMNQSHNWNKEDKASAADNMDRQIRTQTVTAGMQYMFNRKWGAAIRVPYVSRNSTMVMADEMEVDMTTKARVNSIGDIRLNAIYSGISADMSSGITFGLKLPTGQTNAKSIDERNMQIGTGSTDSILGAYHMGKVGDGEKFNWFAQSNWQHTLVTHRGYKPGDEISAAVGTYYNAGSLAGIKKVSPILQITGSKKLKDGGWASDTDNSGYSQAFLAPAIELNFGKVKTYVDVEFPIYQNTNGNQLVPSRIYKLILGYSF